MDLTGYGLYPEKGKYKMKYKGMSNEQHVTNLVNWHRFITDLEKQNNDKIERFLSCANGIFNFKDLRDYTMLNDKLKFLAEEKYKAEHDLIDAAIIYHVPHTKMLQDGHAEDFYTLLIAKARDIDEKGVTLIRKC